MQAIFQYTDDMRYVYIALFIGGCAFILFVLILLFHTKLRSREVALARRGSSAGSVIQGLLLTVSAVCFIMMMYYTESLIAKNKRYLAIIKQVQDEQVVNLATPKDQKKLFEQLSEIEQDLSTNTFTVIINCVRRNRVIRQDIRLVDFLEYIVKDDELTARDVWLWQNAYFYRDNDSGYSFSVNLRKNKDAVNMPFGPEESARVLWSYYQSKIRYIRFKPSAEEMPREDAWYLTRVLNLLDLLSAQQARMIVYLRGEQHKGDPFKIYAEKNRKTIGAIQALATPEKLKFLSKDLVTVIFHTRDYFKQWHLSKTWPGEFEYVVKKPGKKHETVVKGHKMLYQDYHLLLRLYPKLRKKNRKAIFNCFSNLSLY